VSNSAGEQQHLDFRLTHGFFLPKRPYSATDMVSIAFRDGPTCSVHYQLFDRTRKLAAFRDSGLRRSYGASMQNVSRSAGHALIHYLYTNDYHTPNWIGPGTDLEEATAKLKIALEVYVIARQYDLEGLEDLAKKQILLHSSKLNAYMILDAVNEVCPSSAAQDTWFPQFIERVVETALKNAGALAEAGHAPVTTNTTRQVQIPIANTLLRGVLKVHQEMMAEAQMTKDVVDGLLAIHKPPTKATPTPAQFNSQYTTSGLLARKPAPQPVNQSR